MVGRGVVMIVIVGNMLKQLKSKPVNVFAEQRWCIVQGKGFIDSRYTLIATEGDGKDYSQGSVYINGTTVLSSTAIDCLASDLLDILAYQSAKGKKVGYFGETMTYAWVLEHDGSTTIFRIFYGYPILVGEREDLKTWIL